MLPYLNLMKVFKKEKIDKLNRFYLLDYVIEIINYFLFKFSNNLFIIKLKVFKIYIKIILAKEFIR